MYEDLDLNEDELALINDLLEFTEVLGPERASDFKMVLNQMINCAKELNQELDEIRERNEHLECKVNSLCDEVSTLDREVKEKDYEISNLNCSIVYLEQSNGKSRY